MYNKLFSKIVDSSIWMEPDHVRLIWMMFIAIMDEDGFVNLASVKNVAHRAVMDVAKAQEAIGVLEGPDPESSNPANEGRRLTRVPGGWIVNNSREYRDIVKREHQKELNRERVKKHRNRKNCNADVMVANETVTPSEAEAEAEAETKKNTKKKSQKVILTEIEKRFEEWYSLYPRKIAKSSALQAYKKAIQLLGGEASEAMDILIVESKPRLLELAKKEKQFIPHPASWLNSGRWADELETPVKPISRNFNPGPDYDPRTQTPHQYLASKGIIVQ